MKTGQRVALLLLSVLLAGCVTLLTPGDWGGLMYWRRLPGDIRALPQASEQAAAWIAFNGTGTIVIEDSYQVDSVTDDGAGTYTVTWAQAFASTNYVLLGGGRYDAAAGQGMFVGLSNAVAPMAATSCQVTTFNKTAGFVDPNAVYVVAYGRR